MEKLAGSSMSKPQVTEDTSTSHIPTTEPVQSSQAAQRGDETTSGDVPKSSPRPSADNPRENSGIQTASGVAVPSVSELQRYELGR